MTQYIQIPFDTFFELCDDRRNNMWYNSIPDCVYNYAMELLEECGGCSKPEYNDPSYIVDNLAVNGSWEDFDEIRAGWEKYKGLTDEELIAAVEEEAVAVFPEEKIVLWALGF